MKILFKFLLLVLFLTPSDLLACSCAKKSILEKYELSDFIAIVSIEKAEVTEHVQDNIPYQKVSFTIKDTIKGFYPNKYFYTHNPSSGFCGGEMKVNEVYVIFLNRAGYTSICNGTFKLEQGHIQSESKLAEINALRS